MPRPLRRRARRVYLIGVAGHPNFGDEAITRGWLRWLAKHRPHDEVWLDVPNPGGAAALHHGEHPHLVTVDTVHRLGWEAQSEDVAEVAAHARGVIEEPGRSPRWVAGLDALRTADSVHLVGGGFVHARHPNTASVVAAMLWAAARPGIRTAVTGAGLTPSSPELDVLYRELGPLLDVAAVRDPDSATVLPGSAVAPDDVWLGGLEQHLDRRGGQRESGSHVMVLVQGDGHERHDDLTATVIAQMEAWGVESGQYSVVEANPPVDGHVRATLEERFGPHRFYPFVEVNARGLPVAPGQRWISTRYHPHLLAAAGGASGVAISVSDGYYDVKHRAVEAAGSAWPVVGIGSEPVDAGGPGDLPDRARRHTEAVTDLANRIYR